MISPRRVAASSELTPATSPPRLDSNGARARRATTRVKTRAEVRSWRPSLLSGLLLLISLFSLSSLLPAQAQTAIAGSSATPRVDVLHLSDTIQPISEQYLIRGLQQARETHADAVLVELDTPGGLLNSTRSMVHAILDSPVPVIVFVSPSGARAGSAGFFLLEAADVAAMAPGTNAGAAHPVVEGGKLDPIMKQKLENDTTAFLRSYVSIRKRNVDAAQDAVLNSKSYSADEALKLNLVTLLAPDATTLLDLLDGRTVARFNGATTVLHTRNAIQVPLELTTRERILDWLIDPNIALLCLVFGALLIYLEFNTPGTIIPGALGTLLLLTSLFALNLLPVRGTAVMLLLAAAVLFLLEIKIPSHGVLATAAIVAMVVGALTLVAGPIPEQRIRFATALGTGTGFGLITVFLIRIALRARRNKLMTGPDAMLGAVAVAQEPFSPQGGSTPRGQVMVRGELWFAEADRSLAAGQRARVTAVRGLTLLVERIPDAALPHESA